MAKAKGRPIFVEEKCRKDVERAHKIYVKLPFLKKDYAVLKNIPKNATVLDIGCSDGRYLKRASFIRKDLRLIGLDIDTYLASINIQELDLFVLSDCNIRLPFKDESMDFVHCSHVLEHLHAPALFISEIFRVLKKKGLAYIETPEAKRVFLPSFGIIGGVNFYDDPTHIRPYTKESLRRLALQAGFKEGNIKVFFARNWFNILFLPYALFKFFATGYNVYLDIILQPVFSLDVGGVFIKD